MSRAGRGATSRTARMLAACAGAALALAAVAAWDWLRAEAPHHAPLRAPALPREVRIIPGGILGRGDFQHRFRPWATA
ncbi:MAG: hypothetical protein JWM27_89 [Gemmatimonadetes bacterium]|nr:hypothetical protein [Gemmatimonadota bacterium]